MERDGVDRFIIIAAMDEELQRLESELVDADETTVAGMRFVVGQLHHRPVVLSKCGIGKVNAAIGTTLVHQLFRPSGVMNTGSAGGIQNCTVGDVVLGASVLYHDVDATAFGYAFGQVPQEPERFLADPVLLDAAERAIRRLGLSGHLGAIASGDSFMDSEDKANQVRQRHPEVVAVEMEAAAIAQVCHHFQTPCLTIRSISDQVGAASRTHHEAFLELASQNSARLVTEVLSLI